MKLELPTTPEPAVRYILPWRKLDCRTERIATASLFTHSAHFNARGFWSKVWVGIRPFSVSLKGFRIFLTRVEVVDGRGVAKEKSRVPYSCQHVS